MKPTAYLDAVKAELDIDSDYALAKRLEITRGQVLAIRNGSRPMPLAVAFKVAITLQMDPAMVIADLEEQREKNEQRRGFWRSFLSRAAFGIAVICCTLAWIPSATYGSAQALLGGLKNRRLKVA